MSKFTKQWVAHDLVLPLHLCDPSRQQCFVCRVLRENFVLVTLLSHTQCPSALFQRTYLGPVYHVFDRCPVRIVGCVYIQPGLQGKTFKISFLANS